MANDDWEHLSERRERRFLLYLAFVLGFIALLIVRPFAGWVFFGLFLGYVAYPIRAWLTARRMPRWLAAGIGTIALTALIVGPFAIILWQLSDEISAVTEDIESGGPDFFLYGALADVGVPASMRTDVVDALSGVAAAASNRVVPFVTNVVIGSVLTVFVAYATLADGDRLVAWLRVHTPLSEGRREVLFAKAQRGLDAIVFGVIAVAIVQGATAATGWWAFGLPEPLFWGFVLVVTSLVPYVGSYIVLFPAVAWLFSIGDVTRAVGFLLFSVFVVGLVDNLVRPILIGKRARIHPAIVLVGVVGGIPVFGPIGIVVGPLVLAVLLAVVEVLRRPQRAEEAGLQILDAGGDE